VKFFCEAVRLEGFGGFDEVRPLALAANATGEGIAAMLDIEVGFDVGL
jgi:hypothetical protein